MKEIKGVCLDLDQTLVNSEDFMFSPENPKKYMHTAEWELYNFLRSFLKVVDWESFIAIYLKSKEDVKSLLKGKPASHSRYLYIQKSFEHLNMKFKPDLVYDATNVYWNYILSKMELFPDVEDVLKALKREHIQIGIITDLTADIQFMKLKNLGIDRYIDYLVTSEEVDADKPDTKMQELLLKKMGLGKDEVIIIGNNPKTDIQLANDSGVESVLFDFNKKYDVEERNNPTYYTNHFRDILVFLGIEKREFSDDKLIVFDMIGTLTTNPHLISQIFYLTFPSIDTKLVKKYYEDYKIDKISKEEFWRGVGFEKFSDQESRFLMNISLKEGVVDMLRVLKNHYRLAILSNIPKEWGHFIQKQYHFDDIFDEIVFSGDYKTKKPDHKIYQIMVNKFSDIAPENVYFVDDDLDDLKVGKGYLMNTIWLESDQLSREYIPDYVIKDIFEIINIVKK